MQLRRATLLIRSRVDAMTSDQLKGSLHILQYGFIVENHGQKRHFILLQKKKKECKSKKWVVRWEHTQRVSNTPQKCTNSAQQSADELVFLSTLFPIPRNDQRPCMCVIYPRCSAFAKQSNLFFPFPRHFEAFDARAGLTAMSSAASSFFFTV